MVFSENCLVMNEHNMIPSLELSEIYQSIKGKNKSEVYKLSSILNTVKR